MSFSKDLVDKFDLVIQHNAHQRKAGEDFIQLLKQRQQYEEGYAKGLERLANHPYQIAEQGSLCEGIKAMKINCKNRALQARNIAGDIETDIKEIAELLKKLSFESKELSYRGREMEKRVKTHLDKQEKSRRVYMIAAKKLEEQSEVYKMYLGRKDISRDRQVRLRETLNSSQKVFQDADMAYDESTKQTNMVKESYSTNLALILDRFQEMEEEVLGQIKIALRQMVVYETSQLRNLQYDSQDLSERMEAIDPHQDVVDFILTHKSDSVEEDQPVQKEHYPQLTRCLTQHLTDDLNKNSTRDGQHRAALSDNMEKYRESKTISKEQKEKQRRQEEEFGSVAKQVLKTCWNGASPDGSLLERFGNILGHRSGRLVFHKSLNEYRKKSHFVLTETAYREVGKVLNIFLDYCSQNADIESTKLCIVLSQTFYFPETTGEEKPTKIFLQDAIKQHEIWSRIEIWETLVRHAMQEEFKKHEPNYEESHSEMKIRESEIAHSQLITYTHNMLTFGVRKAEVAKIISKFSKTHNLDIAREKSLAMILHSFEEEEDQTQTQKQQQTEETQPKTKLHQTDENHSDQNEEEHQTTTTTTTTHAHTEDITVDGSESISTISSDIQVDRIRAETVMMGDTGFSRPKTNTVVDKNGFEISLPDLMGNQQVMGVVGLDLGDSNDGVGWKGVDNSVAGVVLEELREEGQENCESVDRGDDGDDCQGLVDDVEGDDGDLGKAGEGGDVEKLEDDDCGRVGKKDGVRGKSRSEVTTGKVRRQVVTTREKANTEIVLTRDEVEELNSKNLVVAIEENKVDSDDEKAGGLTRKRTGNIAAIPDWMAEIDPYRSSTNRRSCIPILSSTSEEEGDERESTANDDNTTEEAREESTQVLSGKSSQNRDRVINIFGQRSSVNRKSPLKSQDAASTESVEEKEGSDIAPVTTATTSFINEKEELTETVGVVCFENARRTRPDEESGEVFEADSDRQD